MDVPFRSLEASEQKARPSRAWGVLREEAELSNHLRGNLKNKLIIEKSFLLLERLIYFAGKLLYFVNYFALPATRLWKLNELTCVSNSQLETREKRLCDVQLKK